MMESPYDEIRDNVERIRERMERAAALAGRDPAQISLMAVTKTQPAQRVNAAIACGVTLLGENRAQELSEKFAEYHRDGISIHFIGGLQTNKVRQIIDKVDMIQSLDSGRLAAEIDRQAAKAGRVMDVLIEVNIGGELSKSGVLPGEVMEFAKKLVGFPNLRLRGLMTIPPVCAKADEVENFFFRTRKLFVDIMAENVDNKDIDILSMGMSGDFEPAIRHGATLIRIGSALFGSRE